ncbi:MAG: GNAT family N-acetyltransferase [Chitinophagales bacterium]
MQHIFVRSAEEQDLFLVKMLAEKIWPLTYSGILTAAQIGYMLNRIYSADSLTQQMQEYHHHFLILEHEGKPAGFASYSLNPDDKKGKLQKIYIDTALQGKGLGKFLLEYVAARMKEADCLIIRLDVNRQNKARLFYEKLGFSVTGEKDTDIGNGFFMNDYVMERKIG